VTADEEGGRKLKRHNVRRRKDITKVDAPAADLQTHSTPSYKHEMHDKKGGSASKERMHAFFFCLQRTQAEV